MWYIVTFIIGFVCGVLLFPGETRTSIRVVIPEGHVIGMNPIPEKFKLPKTPPPPPPKPGKFC